MNQTKADTSIPARQWQPLKSLFHNHPVDALMLQIYFIITALAITISNSALLGKLFRKGSKTRAHRIFIILSCSDIGVGIFSIPMVSIPLFKWKIKINALDYTHCFLWIFPACFPYSFSWMLIVIIAFDRVFVITKGQMYKQYIIMKTKHDLFKQHLHVIIYVVYLTELLFIFITLVAYMYLFHFVQSKSGTIASRRHGGADLNKKLTLIVAYTYLCLLLFTLPQVAKQVIVFGWERRIIVNQENRMMDSLCSM